MIRFMKTLVLLNNYQECSVAILTVTVMFVLLLLHNKWKTIYSIIYIQPN